VQTSNNTERASLRTPSWETRAGLVGLMVERGLACKKKKGNAENRVAFGGEGLTIRSGWT